MMILVLPPADDDDVMRKLEKQLVDAVGLPAHMLGEPVDADIEARWQRLLALIEAEQPK